MTGRRWRWAWLLVGLLTGCQAMAPSMRSPERLSSNSVVPASFTAGADHCRT